MRHLIRSSDVKHSNNVSDDKPQEQEALKPESAPPVSSDSHNAEPEMIEKSVYDATIKRLQEQMQKACDQAKQQGIEEGKKLAYEKGYKEGHIEGVASGKKTGEKEAFKKAQESLDEEHAMSSNTLNQLSEKLKQLLTELDQQVDDEIKQFEPVGVELIYEVLLKIIGSRAVDKKLIEDVLAQCLTKCISSQVIKIRVSVEDYQSVIEKSLTPNMHSLLKHIEVTPDVQILPGGCIVETNSGNLDARLESQLKLFKNYLVEVYQQSQAKEGRLA